MSAGDPAIAFLVPGIVINVAATAFAIGWHLKQGVKKPLPSGARLPTYLS